MTTIKQIKLQLLKKDTKLYNWYSILTETNNISNLMCIPAKTIFPNKSFKLQSEGHSKVKISAFVFSSFLLFWKNKKEWVV